MSLYVLGKLVGRDHTAIAEALEQHAMELGIPLTFELDDGDVEVLHEVPVLRESGVFYAIDWTAAVDGVVLWNEATDAVRAAVSDRERHEEAVSSAAANSRLGRFVASVTGLKCLDAGSIGLFDGAVDNTVEVTPDECRRRVVGELHRAWHDASNTLYVWSSPKAVVRE